MTSQTRIVYALLFLIFSSFVSAQAAQLAVSKRAEGLVTVQVVANYPTHAESVACACELPAGMRYQGGSSEPEIRPELGQSGLLEWAAIDRRAGLSFTFNLEVAPDFKYGEQSVMLIVYWVEGGEVMKIEADPVII